MMQMNGVNEWCKCVVYENWSLTLCKVGCFEILQSKHCLNVWHAPKLKLNFVMAQSPKDLKRPPTLILAFISTLPSRTYEWGQPSGLGYQARSKASRLLFTDLPVSCPLKHLGHWFSIKTLLMGNTHSDSLFYNIAAYCEGKRKWHLVFVYKFSPSSSLIGF